MVKLITFDVTKTLLRVKLSVGEQYADTLKRAANIACSASSINETFPKSFEQYAKTYPIFGNNVGISTKVWWRSVFLNTLILSKTISLNATHFGITKVIENDSIAIWKTNEFGTPLEKAFEMVYNDFEYETLPFAHQLLRGIKQKRCIVGVISNSDERIETALETADLSEYIDFAVTSTKCGYQKPDKRIFEYALNLATEQRVFDTPISASSSVHIGDNLEEDYHGAISAGFSAFLLDPNSKFCNVINPEHSIKDLSVVQDKLETVLL